MELTNKEKRTIKHHLLEFLKPHGNEYVLDFYKSKSNGSIYSEKRGAKQLYKLEVIREYYPELFV